MNAKDWNVCIVEPNKFDGKLLLDLLRNAGADKIKVFTDPNAAVDALEVLNANIVIASFELGEADGAAWTKAFRRNKKLANLKAAIFITSGAFSLNMAEQCRHAGANALIGKPLSAKVLTATINKVLSKPRPFIDAEGYVGPCRRAGIVTAGAPKKRRKVDVAEAPAPALTLNDAVEALAAAAARFAADGVTLEPCEAALRQVQAYAVNAGDGPLMRACAAFTLQLTAAKMQKAETLKETLQVCVDGVARLVSIDGKEAQRREAIAEAVRDAVAKAAQRRAA